MYSDQTLPEERQYTHIPIKFPPIKSITHLSNLNHFTYKISKICVFIYLNLLRISYCTRQVEVQNENMSQPTKEIHITANNTILILITIF